MCTPVGHILLGGALGIKAGMFRRFHWVWACLLIVVFVNLPDCDLIFGALKGNPNLYHHLWTHSLAFVIIAGGITGWVMSRQLRMSMVKIVPVFILLIFSHILLDYLAVDRSLPYGIPFFWPLSRETYISPVTPFSDVVRAPDTRAFIPSLFCMHNLRTVLKELVYLGPLFGWVVLWDRRGRRRDRIECEGETETAVSPGKHENVR